MLEFHLIFTLVVLSVTVCSDSSEDLWWDAVCAYKEFGGKVEDERKEVVLPRQWLDT